MLHKNLLTNVLLIDDDEDDCYFFKLAMKEISPHAIIHCSQNSDQVMEMIALTKPSLIFIDFYLPRKSGISCLEQIKNHPLYKEIPVIMWSSGFYTSNVSASYHYGAQLFMEKPSSKQSLVAQLKLVLQQNGTGEDHFATFS